jgi:hypothetical protein
MLRNNFSPVSEVSRSVGKDAAEMRLRPHKRWDEEGVASTVGTIMALMVFMAFLSMFTSQYVPVYMEESEASHMSVAYGQFAALKQAVDMQILAGTIQGTSPVQMFSPVKLGASGIPMFAADTPGYLSVYRKDCYNNVSFSFNTSATVLDYYSNTGGSIKLNVQNRYYIPQTLAYEGDALILRQSDGEYMKAMPQFIVTRAGSSYLISYTQLDLRGDDSNYVGFGTRGIQTTLKSVTTTTFNNLTDEVGPGIPAKYPYLYFNHTTWYERAWNTSFNQTLFNAGMIYGTDYWIISTLRPNADPINKLWEVSVRIDPAVVRRLTLTVAYVEVSTAEMGAV